MTPVRLPGIIASLFSDRTIRVPQALQVEAADELEFRLVFRLFLTPNLG
ncbi:hypothetical protein JYQ62_08225 [Nostoc sp. UHCC 0702]|nr:hypothetical protein JYQ62_08225 [Nostoc sp. UHCC 0702]